MNVNNIPLMVALKEQMGWLTQNQQVISQNIANADTPGYRAQKLEEKDFSSLVADVSKSANTRPTHVRMLATRAGHIGAGGISAQEAQTKDNKDYEESPDGNAVVLEEEMINLADNQMKYGMAVNLYKKHLGIMKIALGKGK